jgi:predicted nucleotidyltransferase
MDADITINIGALLPADEMKVMRVPWLDERTDGLVCATVAAVAQTHPQCIAAILFGSVARHDERPLTDGEPSDVDVLLLFDIGSALRRFPQRLTRSIYQAIGRALDAYLYSPREVQTVIGDLNVTGWDPAFVGNVARDGLLLWSRGPLPDALAAVAARGGGYVVTA